MADEVFALTVAWKRGSALVISLMSIRLFIVDSCRLPQMGDMQDGKRGVAWSFAGNGRSVRRNVHNKT